jgi:hypothetical protein
MEMTNLAEEGEPQRAKLMEILLHLIITSSFFIIRTKKERRTNEWITPPATG